METRNPKRIGRSLEMENGLKTASQAGEGTRAPRAAATLGARPERRIALLRPSQHKGPHAARSREGFLLTLPALVLLVISVVYPILWALNLSVHTFDVINPSRSGQFVGLANYVEILSSSDFRAAFLNTVAFVT